MADNITSRMEDYLEAIYLLTDKKKTARVRDIAKHLNVSRSTVSNSLHTLSDKGYIEYSPYDTIELTGQGLSIAKDVYRKHSILKRFFLKILGADERMAEENACKIEHAITEELLDRFVSYIEFAEECMPVKFKYNPDKGHMCLDE
ncbi:metal-dependent transcriptional regulator [Spirochaetia bacterium 38H-sp]|uniref:Transcriptional regulator MntR n=1 Tax=Rarispira pelagica TaxID=3141764 RepID=A0ABU9UBW9_9SPIR